MLSIQHNWIILTCVTWFNNIITIAIPTFVDTLNIRYINSQKGATQIFKNVPPSVVTSGLCTLFPVWIEALLDSLQNVCFSYLIRAQRYTHFKRNNCRVNFTAVTEISIYKGSMKKTTATGRLHCARAEAAKFKTQDVNVKARWRQLQFIK